MKDASWNSLLSNLKPTGDTKSNNESIITDDEDSDDDEFFEAQEEITPRSATDTHEDEGVKVGACSDDGALKEAEGVLKETEMKLLCTGKPLCIPITQVINRIFELKAIDCTYYCTSKKSFQKQST